MGEGVCSIGPGPGLLKTGVGGWQQNKERFKFMSDKITIRLIKILHMSWNHLHLKEGRELELMWEIHFQHALQIIPLLKFRWMELPP